MPNWICTRDRADQSSRPLEVEGVQRVLPGGRAMLKHKYGIADAIEIDMLDLANRDESQVKAALSGAAGFRVESDPLRPIGYRH